MALCQIYTECLLAGWDKIFVVKSLIFVQNIFHVYHMINNSSHIITSEMYTLGFQIFGVEEIFM